MVETKSQVLSNRTYDVLKFIAQLVLPAAGALYFALSEIWGLPYGIEVVGTITAVDAFLGALLGLSSQKYNNSDAKYDGSIDVKTEDDAKLFTLNLDGDPDQLDQKQEVLFKINTLSNPE